MSIDNNANATDSLKLDRHDSQQSALSAELWDKLPSLSVPKQNDSSVAHLPPLSFNLQELLTPKLGPAPVKPEAKESNQMPANVRPESKESNHSPAIPSLQDLLSPRKEASPSANKENSSPSEINSGARDQNTLNRMAQMKNDKSLESASPTEGNENPFHKPALNEGSSLQGGLERIVQAANVKTLLEKGNFKAVQDMVKTLFEIGENGEGVAALMKDLQKLGVNARFSKNEISLSYTPDGSDRVTESVSIKLDSKGNFVSAETGRSGGIGLAYEGTPLADEKAAAAAVKAILEKSKSKK